MIEFSNRVDGITEYYFSSKLREVKSLIDAGNEIINLGIGSPDLSPPDSVVKKLIESLNKEGAHKYQNYKGIDAYRKEISNFYKLHYGCDLNYQSEILPLIGSKEGIFHISMSFLSENDKVLIPNPGYPTYSSITNLIGNEIIYYDLIEKNHWFPDLKKLSRLDLSKVKTKDFNEEILNGDNLYKFSLPKSGTELEFKLLTHGDELEITKENQALARLYKGKGDTSFDVTTRLKYMIQSVDGNQDRGYITKWDQNSFLALDTKAFRKFVREISPDMDLKFNFVSELTGEEEALDIPFGVSFFYPSE